MNEDIKEIRIISPAGSFSNPENTFKDAINTLEKETQYKVTFGSNSGVVNKYGTSSITERIDDLHDAYEDSNVAVIIAMSGGYSSNDLLPYVDWDIIKKNQKPLIGSSDLTVLINAIYTKTGSSTFYGPNFFKYGMHKGLEYTLLYFKKALISDEDYFIEPSDLWSDDKWYLDQINRDFKKNTGFVICNEGEAEGTIIGGHLSSLNLLQGTEYMPPFKKTILCIEEDTLDYQCYGEFKRNIQSLLQATDTSEIKGILIGRFLTASKMGKEDIIHLVKSIEKISNIPIIANVDFGHTDPSVSFPIGGKLCIKCDEKNATIQVIK